MVCLNLLHPSYLDGMVLLRKFRHDVKGKFCLCITRGYYLLGSGEAMMIVEALLEVTSHPEDTIAELTYNFWYRLSSTLTRRYNNVWSRVI